MAGDNKSGGFTTPRVISNNSEMQAKKMMIGIVSSQSEAGEKVFVDDASIQARPKSFREQDHPAPRALGYGGQR